MSFRRIKQQGMTLLEVLLVLAIAASVFAIVFQTYQSMRSSTDAQEVGQQVNTMFQALSGFYKANCSRNISYQYAGAPTYTTAGLLDPSNAPPNPYSVSITAQLVTAPNNYIKQWPLPINPFIDNTATDHGFVVQFNLVANAPNQITDSLNGQIPIGKLYLWQSQVAIKLRNAAEATTDQNLLQANCTSSLNGATVFPCNANKPGGYLVWERMPSLSQTTMSISPFWVSVPMLTIFNRQYSNDTFLEMNSASWAGTQYYLCGG